MNAVRLAVDPRAAVERLRPVERYSVDGATVHELAAGSAVFELLADGVPVGAFTLSVHDTAAGRVIHCGAAAGRGDDLAGTIDRFMVHEAQRVGARMLTCETRRRGLVRRLKRAGWHQAGAHRMTKET